jgi:phosphoribosylformylglycinamidine synthase
MLSESQERMLVCVKKGKEQEVIDIFEKWDLDVAVIGEVTDTGRMELMWHGERVCDMPIAPVSEEAPILDRPTARPKYLDEISGKNIDSYEKIDNQTAFEKLLGSMEVVDKAWIYDQYDSMVQTNTTKAPGSLDASCIRIKENGKALAMSSDCNPRYCYVDPHKGGALAVMESGRNVAMSGARPLSITDCLNFGNPENPEVMWQFAEACEGIKEACLALNTPVVSGNVSLYNETNGVSVFPTPAIAMVGLNEDEHKVLASSFQEDENHLILIGDTKAEFGGSLYIKELFGETTGSLAEIDYEKELALWKLVIDANAKGLLESAKDLSSGGIAITLAKMAAVSGRGVVAGIRLEDKRAIFDESQSRAILEVSSKENMELVLTMAKGLGLSTDIIGKVGGDVVKINDVEMKLESVKATYFKSFKEVVEQDI